MTLAQHNAEDTCLNNRRQPPAEEGVSQSSVLSLTTPTDSGILDKAESLGSGESTSRESLSRISVPGNSLSKEVVAVDAELDPPSREDTDRDSVHHANHYDAFEPALHRSMSTATHPDFPEGGLEAWLVVFGSFCAMISVFGLINSSAVFESYFSTHQLIDNTASEIGWIFSLYLFIVFFVGIQVGPVFDRYGARIPVAASSLLIVLSLMLLSLSETYYQIILTYSVLGGLGGALLNSPAYGAIAHFFDERRGLATGIATTSGGLGGIIFPIILREMLPNLGFPWSCRVLGFIMIGLAVPANLFIKTRLRPKRGPDGHPIIASVWPDLTIFRDLRFAFSAIGIFFMEWGLFVPLTFIISYAAAHGQDATESYVLLSYLNAGSVVGRILPGFLADKFGRFNMVLVTISLCVITLLALWLPAGDSPAMLIAYAVLFGFASGSNLGLLPVCVGQLCDHRQFGLYFSTAMMAASFGTLSSVPIGGALLETGKLDDGWGVVIIFAGASYAVALGCYTMARVLAVGWSPLQKF
ncbi:major facilitator superfamily domain-containing protein [Cercophora scortea]|uniref:Major facilitator superfamily domain-containing protein n=1 Tax=Cercophora scortea TaxID=314031 RepID=A0AAE0I527_9PEZI|nr:major facilitator superfamily domain-containing protein [Cercophora scortea]